MKQTRLQKLQSLKLLLISEKWFETWNLRLLDRGTGKNTVPSTEVLFTVNHLIDLQNKLMEFILTIIISIIFWCEEILRYHENLNQLMVKHGIDLWKRASVVFSLAQVFCAIINNMIIKTNSRVDCWKLQRKNETKIGRIQTD